MFRQATKQQSKLRMTLDGPAGSGKTFTALRFAHALVAQYGGKIALIDTERGSASKYVGEAPDGVPFAFDVLELSTYSPEQYTNAIVAAGKMRYTVLVIDSLSHAWEGTGGALEIKSRIGAEWSAWRQVTPIHNRMVDAILQNPCHVITTMRSRMEYVQEEDERGKKTIRKVGMAPIQRPGMEYEFDLVCDIDWAHLMMVSKSRCSAVADMTVEKPGAGFMQPVIDWLRSGVKAEPAQVPAPAVPPSTEQQAPAITLDGLLQQYGPEKVMEACGGNLPNTPDEAAAVEKILKGG